MTEVIMAARQSLPAAASRPISTDPVRDGTFVDSVHGVTLFHPAQGVLRSSPSTAPDVFGLTCGGYGLMGVIVCASLRLEAKRRKH